MKKRSIAALGLLASAAMLLSSPLGAQDKPEELTPMLDPDGIWRVSGYYIK